MLEHPNYKLYCDRSIIIDWTVQNNRLDIAIFDKAIKEAYLTDVAIRNSHKLHSTITEKLQKYTNLKVEEIIIWQSTTPYSIISTTHNAYYSTQITQKYETA